MRVRPVSAGWVRAGFFAILAIAVYLIFSGVIDRSSQAAHTFALTALAIAVLPMLQEIRRRRGPNRVPVHWELLPVDVIFERVGSPRSLAWPLALLLWVLVPLAGVVLGINAITGELVHDLPGAMGGALAAVCGALAGLAAWMALRTVVVWRLGSGLGRWPAWTYAPPASLRFRPFIAEWRTEPVYYYRRRRP
jgi:hypothetical protein